MSLSQHGLVSVEAMETMEVEPEQVHLGEMQAVMQHLRRVLGLLLVGRPRQKLRTRKLEDHCAQRRGQDDGQHAHRKHL